MKKLKHGGQKKEKAVEIRLEKSKQNRSNRKKIKIFLV